MDRPLPSHVAGNAAVSAAAGWSPARIRALGLVTDLPTAAAILGISRSTAYELVTTGEFPLPVIRIGSRYRVPIAALLTALHVPIEADDAPAYPPT